MKGFLKSAKFDLKKIFTTLNIYSEGFLLIVFTLIVKWIVMAVTKYSVDYMIGINVGLAIFAVYLSAQLFRTIVTNYLRRQKKKRLNKNKGLRRVV